MAENNEKREKGGYSWEPSQRMVPIEPEKKKITKYSVLKMIIFLFFISYLFISYYHAPILTRLGRYLILEHTLKKSDLIVCLAGENIERGLATADAYHNGLAPTIFITREKFPDGYEILKERGVNYPQSVDLLVTMLLGLGIPESALIISENQAGSTIEEAQFVRKEVEKRGFKSIIILTSPTHTRRAWLTFKKVFEETDVRIMALPSKYSKFRPEDWWKKREYVRDVIIEYQKLIFYVLQYAI